MNQQRSRLRDLAGRATARLRGIDERTPLRVKLVAALLLLVVVTLLVSGLVATTTMRGYLVDRVDSQLRSAVPGLVEHGLNLPGGPAEGPGGHDLPSAFVVEVTNARGHVVFGPTSNLTDPHESLPRLPRPVVAGTGSRSVEEFTVPAVRGHDQWRVLAQPVQLGNGADGTLLVAQSLADVQDTVGRLGTLLLVIGGVAVVALGGLAYLLVRASLRPLREVEDTAAAIAAGDLSQRVRPGDSRTEVGHLSHSFNDMLARVESAFAVQAASEAAARQSEERMRRFVADASHELRTPLTSIRGFAELYRQGAARESADVAQLMRRIEDEGARMGVLVEDLLLLARLDQQRPLDQLPVDLLVLATDAVHDARAVAADRAIDLAVGDLPQPPVVVGDEARLRQVLGNLVGNALQHTPAGTPIEVRLHTEQVEHSGAVVVEVVDHGPGMSADEAARSFERFYRADASRNRAEGGTGLGLAIVSALVTGHGGTVTVDTAPGAGATFRVELPIASTHVA